MHVVGTAGHVDHGKSCLVKALTGIDPDRLPEEKARGMTIDLGFAWLRLPSGREISIVDVPGHEQFIKNMLAGVGCIDAALLVVAANDGVMPQTREHLAILDLLQVQSGMVAITKKDMVDPELVEMAVEETRDVLAGTSLADAPLVAVSAVTGEGLAQLVATLDQVLEETRPRLDVERPRLWIDRAFTIGGFGTVATGALIDGDLRMGQEVEVLPGGKQGRIRTLQTHKNNIEIARPSTRVAVNLPDLAVNDLKRGNVLTIPGQLKPTKRLDVRLRCLPGVMSGLRDGMVGRLFIGTADVQAKVRLLAANSIAPGETALAQLSLAEPTVAAAGDRFVLRHPAMNVTIGGGVVLDPHPIRHYRYRQPVIAALETMERGAPPDILRRTLGDKPPVETLRLQEWTSLAPAEFCQAAADLIAAEEVILLGADANAPLLSAGNYLVSQAGWQRLVQEITRLLSGYHRRYPLRPAMPKEDLRSRLEIKPDVFRFVISQAAAAGVIAEQVTAVRLSDYQVRITPQQEEKARRLLQAHRQAPFTPPTATTARTEYGIDAELLQAMVDRGDLVKVGEEEYFARPVFDQMVAEIVAWIKREGPITLQQARALFNTTRRYIMHLLDYMDDLKITRRVGDTRVLRKFSDEGR